ncbi:hypothetical protein [Alienimonas californiensis]|uniref:hypothetical protein n=1 Tax=Alienimonas californiensis TaxID=2527989 RepID=UPI0013FD08AC|nr:hypothetical protein [Alienimonas californiensis]
MTSASRPPQTDNWANRLPPAADPIRSAARLREFFRRLRPDLAVAPPAPPVDGAAHPTLERRPRPPWVPAPPPHLDPDRSAEERQAAVAALLAERSTGSP